jgi:biotin operon repressor
MGIAALKKDGMQVESLQSHHQRIEQARGQI